MRRTWPTILTATGLRVPGIYQVKVTAAASLFAFALGGDQGSGLG